MANELEGYGQSGLTTYAIIKRRGLFWDGSAFATYATDDRNNYAVTLTELGDASGQYQGNFPSGITESGSYSYAVYQSQDGTVSEADTYVSGGVVDWTGTAAANASSGAMTGEDFYDYVLRIFKRDDKSQEVYDAITDTIRDLRLRYEFDEATEDAASTDTISTLGDYKIELESNLSLLLSVTLQDGYNGHALKIIPFQRFMQLYPDINVSNNRGFPRHASVFAGSLYLGPIPDQTSFTYRLAYSSRGGTVTSSTSAVPFTAVDRELVRHGALSRLFIGQELPELAAVHEGLYQKRFDINESRDRRNKGAGYFVQNPFLL